MATMTGAVVFPSRVKVGCAYASWTRDSSALTSLTSTPPSPSACRPAVELLRARATLWESSQWVPTVWQASPPSSEVRR